jgi:hypothetical protein
MHSSQQLQTVQQWYTTARTLFYQHTASLLMPRRCCAVRECASDAQLLVNGATVSFALTMRNVIPALQEPNVLEERSSSCACTYALTSA